MKRIYILISILSLCFTFNSCNYLDVEDYFKDTLPYDSIFQNSRNVQRYLWATASQLPDEGAVLMHSYTPGPLATDEAFALFTTSQFRGMAFVLGEVTPDNSRGMNAWGDMYKIIRKCNIILSRVNSVPNISTSERVEITGYTQFLRAYAYYNILMDYGPVILLGNDILESNETPDYYANHRATYDESVDYICEQFEQAAKYMPEKVILSYFGRPSRGAAYALIARLRLQQASPLYNGGNAARAYFSSWKRSVDDINYVSQTYDEKKWAIAAAAAKRVIDMNLYTLHTVPKDATTLALPESVSEADFPNGAGNIDPFKSYSYMFNGESVTQTNPEYIWGRMSGAVRDITRHSFNMDIMGGWNGMSIPQKIIDNYRMFDGRTINNSSYSYPYSEDGMDNSGKKVFSGYTLNNGVSKMYTNREMRFYASIGFSRRFWPALSTSETARKNLTITYDKNGNSGRYSATNNESDYPITGYVITKFIHETDAWKGEGAARIDKGFPIIRYAEILMSYAEALNNLKGSHIVELDNGTTYTVSRNTEEMKSAFDQIRYRAGLPGLTQSELSNPDLIQKLIEQERMIEFLFENRRYYDVRRWGIYEETEKEPITGMNIEASEPEYYTRVIANHAKVRNRIVNKRMIFLPIPKNEVRKVKGLDQNPGWPN